MKSLACYEVAEAAKLLGVHRNTVRRWIKDGLETVDARRPTLIHGTALKSFLIKRRRARRRPCGPAEFYCFACREPRTAWGNAADVRFRTPKLVTLTALCASCETTMHRSARACDLPKFAALMDLQTMEAERLIGRSGAT